MKEFLEYRIQIQGKFDRDDLNRNSPVNLFLGEGSGSETYIEVHTDQSGLIGVLRYLHQRGIVIRSMNLFENSSPKGCRHDRS